jgi:hypothetical protein
MTNDIQTGDDDLLSPGEVYVRRSYDATYPARVEVVPDDTLLSGYRVEVYDMHGTLKGTQNPAYRNSPGAAGVSLAKIEQGVREDHLERTDAAPGDLPPSTDDRVATFRESDRAATAGDVIYDSTIFSRWQNHGHDRLSVRDPGEGYIDLTDDVRLGESLVHPAAPIMHIGGIDTDIADPETDDGRRVVFAHDGASSHWPILVFPSTGGDD